MPDLGMNDAGACRPRMAHDILAAIEQYRVGDRDPAAVHSGGHC